MVNSTSSPVTTSRDGNVLVVVADNPPVNALGVAVRRGLADAIAQAEADSEVAAVVIRCAGRTFFAGADITEFGKPPLDPSLPEVVSAIEACSKPVAAAIHGTALGGGLEVALGCHYRIAVPSAKLGLPEVKLGILPGAGGTQRLPRLIGPEPALDMIVSGNPIPAGKAAELGLVDEIVDGDLAEAALRFAREAASKPLPQPTGQCTDRITGTPSDLFTRYREANARKFKGFAAPDSCLKAVEAATTLPLTEGLALERSLFRELVSGPQSLALRHVFFAERAAARIDGLPEGTEPLPIGRVGIIGAGTMGGGIAMNFLSAGVPVRLVEREQAPLDKGVATIRRNYEATAAKGRLTTEAVEQAMGLLSPTLALEDLADCDLIIEAVFELMEIKLDVFARLDRIAAPHAILATNTSYLDVNKIAAATSRPEQVIGLHFFSPANVMKLLEVVRGEKTAPQVLATAMALARKIGKVAVVSGVCHGFIGNRMLAVRQAQASALLLEGAQPQRIDKVLTDFGFPMGPFQMSDLAGLDIGWDPAKSSSSTVREVLCERGRLGQKAGKGFYDYDDKRRPSPSPEVDAVIAEFAARSGQPPREIDDHEILERLLYPMIDEGARILEEGIAQRASDIDVVWLNGYGWPAWTGGPMFWADETGLATIVAGLDRHAERLGNRGISQLLRDKAAKGERFGE
jgi:3-hydroxyacyl-CoA dehydrogenase